MIQLKEINKDNVVKACFLTTNKDAKATASEEFVAGNALSIAQSKYEPNTLVKAIYDDETMVGFAMYGIDEHDECWIIRFMIDHKFQGKGYGKNAFQLIVDDMINLYHPKEIKISIEPENVLAKKLYEKAGFVDTKVIEDDELVLLYTL